MLSRLLSLFDVVIRGSIMAPAGGPVHKNARLAGLRRTTSPPETICPPDVGEAPARRGGAGEGRGCCRLDAGAHVALLIFMLRSVSHGADVANQSTT